ncbi:hypothetical protein AVEN_88818-1 [Araneus ventricosus]|uniref:ATP-dependent DNA helicase n=1 Tax=Araneus ventricosus TaxID=182803 RepID=A0A4Y2PUW5_ARAVE|nr:hypothetical protein AVEN_88818-1 [Araneus ventricosus]
MGKSKKNVSNRRKQDEVVEGHDGIQSGNALGRVYTVHSRNTDCYYLQQLLHKIKGTSSFKDLQTVNGIEYETYREACLALGLLENDKPRNEKLKEAAYSDSPSKIRTLFAVIPSFCDPPSPKALWENNKDCMYEDILNKLRSENRHIVLNYTDSIYNEALIKIEDKVLQMIGKSLSEREPLLNTDQQAIYREVLRRYSKSEGEKNIALAVATSGIAATLTTGGTNRTFNTANPHRLNSQRNTSLQHQKGSAKAEVLQEDKALSWEEISINRTPQDLRANKDLLGGLIVVLAGNFRQTLPVIPRGTMADEIKACLKSSYLWKQVKIMKLKRNIRIQNNCQNSQKFSEYLLKIGDEQEAKKQKMGKSGFPMNSARSVQH